MKILLASSEIYPFAKTGGLADVAGALPKALKKIGVDGRVPSLLDNIFNPFFTTKEKGSGLGLAISNKIVMHHNGHVEVRNRAGEGAIFVVYLPVSSKTLTREG